ILTGIDNDIYSTVDACPNACEMWKAIKRFYKMMNELIRNQCKVTNHQVNVQFLLQLQPEWHSMNERVNNSYLQMKNKLSNKCSVLTLRTTRMAKHSIEVNEIRAESIARTVNPLALVAQQQPVYHPQNHPTHYTQNSSTRSQQAATRNRGKAIVNSPIPIYDQEPSMVAKDDEISKDKEIDKLMALISLSFKKIYKPINNNLRTSSNTSRANQDNSLRINRGAGYDNQRLGNVAGARENVGTMVVQKSGIQCYNCKEFRHVARECQKPKRKPKRVKDAAYHRENMLLCKQEEAGIQLNAEQADWRDDTDDELEDQELEAHYMYMAQLQEVSLDVADSRPIFDTEPVQKVLIEKLKGEIEDFKNKNKSLESSNYRFKEANNKLSETNNLLYTDFKKSQAKLARCNSVEYASKKEAQIKLYKTRKDKELDKVIALENKVKVFDNIVYKTCKSVQTMNTLNNKCRTSFAKPEFLKKAQRANPRLYDI
nr:hypothetical protein [Tanacetum cinerariifolium]